MPEKRNPLPPLDYLLAFESAAACQSFAGASRDLHISETAISRKVRLLELHYGTPLFLRSHRSIKLTAQGRMLRDKINPALEILRDVSHQMISKNTNNTVTLAATNSVASLWLMPRLHKFNQSNKQFKIMLIASDNDQECLADNVDLSILRGNGNWPGYHTKFLFGETIFPVCSPTYLEANPQIADMSTLPNQALIEISSTHSEWMGWKTWLAKRGVVGFNRDQATTFNTYPLAVQAAKDGLGMALGWSHMVDHMLSSGELVRPLGNLEVRTDFGYYLLRPEKQQDFPGRSSVENWLLEASATRNRYG